MELFSIYTDGGCHGNPGPGAWAYRVVSPEGDVVSESSGFETVTTNNRMELSAVICGLKWVKQSAPKSQEVVLLTDSEYVRKGITEWIKRWRSNGWMTSARKPVKNRDLWQELYEITSEIRPSWRWVKGHAGNEHNEACDRMVQATIQENGSN